MTNEFLTPPSKNDMLPPFAQEKVILTRHEYIELKAQINFYKAEHQRAVERESTLKQKLAEEQAKVRDLTQRLYGKKSESRKKTEKALFDGPKVSARSRGQQQGSKGHGRTPRPDLPIVIETRDVAEEQKHCDCCGLPYKAFGTEDSDIIEVEVRAYTRRVKRKKYASQCQCKGTPRIVVAPPAVRIFPHTNLGISVWVELLLDKFQQSQATHRWLNDLASLGCPLSQGTVTGGLKHLTPLFKPIGEALMAKQLTEQLFHADETGWEVFEHREGKANHHWYLWLLQSPSVAYYLIAPGRNADVPIQHFTGLAGGLEVFLVCDRYSAYKKLAKWITAIVLAFCWAHVRRDFLDAARSWPEIKEAMLEWVNAIGQLYHLNALRLTHWNKEKTLEEQTPAFKHQHKRLLKQLARMKQHRDTLLAQKELHQVQRGVLLSLKNHWSGLILFVEHPQIPMDNNIAERSLRNPVTGRKRYYGSGSAWSAKLATAMFSILKTLHLWEINPRHWLSAYLNTCAEYGGKAPSDISSFLPWEMTAERLSILRHPPPIQNSG